MIDKNLIKNVGKKLKLGGTIYAVGNGGSSAEASHLIAELIGKFRKKRKPIRAISLIDPAVTTCIANDFGFEYIFSRQLTALLTQKDILIVFTTSGKSENILNAINVALIKKSLTVGICGNNYHDLKCDYILVSEGDTSDKIQEGHIKYVHELTEEIEKYLGV